MARNNADDLKTKATCPIYYIRQAYGGINTCREGNTSNGRPFQGSVLPNCTGYAQGRVLEMIGAVAGNSYAVQGLNNNAKSWFSDASSCGLQTSQTPQVGAVAVWNYGENGHVAVVEQVISNTDIICSESNWSNDFFDVWQGNPTTRLKSTLIGYVLPESTVSGGTYDATEWYGYKLRTVSDTEMKNNAQMVAQFCQTHGWTLESTCAVLGNMEQESGINTLVYQGYTSSGDGFGLTQISSGMLGQYSNGYQTAVALCSMIGITSPSSEDADGWGDAEMSILQAIIENTVGVTIWVKRDTWNTSGADFIANTGSHSLDELTLIFEQNYENAGVPVIATRQANAKKWYEYIKQFWGSSIDPDPYDKKSNKTPLKQIWRRFRKW